MATRVQREDFDAGAELAAISDGETDIGAVASFIGLVRGRGETGAVDALTLEHYPGMTERKLAEAEAEARARWPLDAVRIVHRFGRLLPGEQIVFVATASAHRAAAFDACAFLIDWLKTEAPFWKLEDGPSGSRWVATRDSDQDRARRWQEDGAPLQSTGGAEKNEQHQMGSKPNG